MGTVRASERRRTRTPWHARILPRGRPLSDEVWKGRHKALTLMLWAHLPTLFGFALLRGFGVVDAVTETLIVLIPAMVAILSRLSRNVRSSSTALGLVVCASFFVHLANGSIEGHFMFFVDIAFLTLYQAWLPLLMALFYVVVEHGLIGGLDPSAVYNNRADIRHPWEYAGIHGAFILAASFANILSWRLTEQVALHDGLTGLPNRDLFLDSLNHALNERDRKTTAVLFVDLDNFKDANDGFGHDVGDALLVAVAQRFQHALRPVDMLARLGGDEFAVLLTDLYAPDDARDIANRLLASIDKPFALPGVTLSVDASIGMAFAEDDQTAAGLLRNADLAMYDAKRSGARRLAEFHSGLHAAALRRTELEAELAIALDRDEFVLHYQPIYDVLTSELVGTEALVRWQHPTRGLLGPGEFLAAAEQSSLILRLGEWVLETACRQTALWQQQQPDRAPITVAVNFSPRQLVEPDLVTRVVSTLRRTGLDAASLCIEVTEGSIIEDFDAVQPVLQALRALNVSVALDDFGTGYSSLGYLRQLPVDVVKIDRTFVSELDHDTASAQIVRAIVDLAHTLQMSVTAEGTETTQQLDVLTSLRSDRVQGYLLSRPADAATIGERVAERRWQASMPAEDPLAGVRARLAATPDSTAARELA